jgi:hypothetical protein
MARLQMLARMQPRRRVATMVKCRRPPSRPAGSTVPAKPLGAARVAEARQPGAASLAEMLP